MFEVNEELFNDAANELGCVLDSINANGSLVNNLCSNVPSDLSNFQQISDVMSDYNNIVLYTKDLIDKINQINSKLHSINSVDVQQQEEKEGFFKSVWHSITDTASSWNKGVSSVFQGKGFDDLLDAFKQTGATLMVIDSSVLSGAGKVGECLVDGASFCGGKLISGAFSFFSEDKAKEINNSVMDFIRKDHVDDIKTHFFEDTSIGQWINKKSNLKYNSSGAKGIETASELVSKVALATAATVFSGGTAAPVILGALYGIGDEEEKYAKTVDRDLGEDYDQYKAFIKSVIGVVGGSAEFYGFGQLGSGIVSGLTAASQGAAATGIEGGISNLNTSFKHNFLRKFFATDTFLDTGATVTRHGLNYAIGDESFDELVKSGGTELLFSLGLAAFGSSIGAYVDSKGAQKILNTYNNVDDFFSNKTSYSNLNDLIAGENLDLRLLKHMSPDEATALFNKIDANNSSLFRINGYLNPITDNLTINQLDNIIKNNKIDELSMKYLIYDLDSIQLGNGYSMFSKESKHLLQNDYSSEFFYNVLKDNNVSDQAYRNITLDMSNDDFEYFLFNEKIINTSKLSNKAKYYNEWASTEMVNKFKNSDFANMFSSSKLVDASNNVFYLDKEYFSKLIDSPKAAAFNTCDSGISCMNISSYTDDVIKHNSVHEIIHALSRSNADIGGFSYYNNNTGINESMTELLARNISGDKWNNCGYNKATDCLNDIIDLGIDDLNFQKLGEAYFKNDLGFFNKNISKAFGNDPYLTNELLSAFDEAVDNSSNSSKLEKLVDALALASKKNR